MKILLLPGMDGTGQLFGNFAAALDGHYEIEIIRYPTDECLTYAELEHLVRSAIPDTELFAMIAESFSSPLAVKCAARGMPNLKCLVLCAGFVSSPIRGWRRSIYTRIAPLIFGKPLPEFAAKLFLVGSDASPKLLGSVKAAISAVQPKVLAARVREIFACEVRSELSRITVPMLYLQAERDRLVGPECLEEIQKSKPRIAVVKIAAPHLLFQLEPQQAAEAVTAFLQQIPIN